MDPRRLTVVRAPAALRLALALSLLLCPPVSARANLASPVPGIESAAQWVKAGQISQLPVVLYGGQTYVSVDHVARLSDAQLRWQPAGKRVCLSNSNGDLCFDWDDNRAERDGRRLHGSLPLRFENDHLFVPISFVASKDFGAFADADLSWDSRKSVLTHNPRVNLRVPQVEKDGGVYRISIDVNPLTPPQLIEQSRREIWLRFSRAATEGSQVFEGDTVISEVRVVQKRHSADFIVKLGENVRDSDVYFDDGRRKLVIEVQPDHDVPDLVDSTPKPAPPPVPSAVPARAASAPKHAPRVAEKPLPIVAAHPVAPAVPAASVVRSSEHHAVPAAAKDGQRVIVVDAGHGGMDCGAIGARGTLEKDINLEVARLLAKELRKQKGVRVVMTRDRDVFIPLDQRTAIANAAGANLFVSVHCNSSLSSKSRGFEAYFLSPDATDRAAAAVARVENSVVSLEAQKGAGTPRLESLLASMAVSNYLNESSKFAGIVSRNVRSRVGVDDASVKEANFFVLRGAQMPSVLLELEYLSNPVSELRLRSSRFRAQMVKGIVDGIMSYNRTKRLEREAYAEQLRRESRIR